MILTNNQNKEKNFKEIEIKMKVINKIKNNIINNKKYDIFYDISKWNTINVTDMSYMFYEYSSLKSLSDISKWNTNNVSDMSG